MIPLKDTIPSRTYPIINVSLILVNIIVFIMELGMGRRLDEFIFRYGLIPYVLFFGGHIDIGIFSRIFSLFTAMFLHGGWFHIGGNMLYLWIFGDNVEDRMGHLRFLIFYLSCGIIANLVQAMMNPFSKVPIVGASGAIAGVLGAYFILYPWARVLTIIPVFFFLQIVEVPALFFLGIWFFMQFLSGTASIAHGIHGGVAWWAHIGGFISGVILVFLFVRRRRSHILP